jgi:diguanylate cyclase (GGDEF)-like protein/PAS domain S-box-containing protein
MPIETVKSDKERLTTLHEPLSLFRAILASATDYAIITLDASRLVTSWNAGAQRIFQYKQHEIIGRLGDVFFTREDLDRKEHLREAQGAIRTGRAADNRWHVRKDGSRFWGEGVVTPIFDANDAHMGYLKIMRDMTERKVAETEMFRLAHFDPLTGLANRNYFQARLEEMIAVATRHKQLLIVHLLDLDGFKQINDSMGHIVGDMLLQQAAQRMRGVTRESDFLARHGGDEFVVLQPDARSPQVGEALASKLLDALSSPFHIEGREVVISASIGLAVCPQDGSDPTQLLRKADLALYRVKGSGNPGFRYFTDQMDEDAHRRQRNVSELRRAVQKRAFSIEYQPEVNTLDGRIVAVEALLRSSNPVLSRHSTDELVALGVETGLMAQIGLWVLSEACAQNKKWRDAGLPPIRVSVNFSPRELANTDLPDLISTILERSGLRTRDLEIEITEQQFLHTDDPGLEVLEELRERGVSLVLDDFGSGYSALRSLRRLPINRLKLDRKFMKEIPRDEQSCAIAKAVIDMAHTLDLDVVAEGVESAEQADFCRQEGCDALQGTFVSPPLAPGDMATLLSNQP